MANGSPVVSAARPAPASGVVISLELARQRRGLGPSRASSRAPRPATRAAGPGVLKRVRRVTRPVEDVALVLLAVALGVVPLA